MNLKNYLGIFIAGTMISVSIPVSAQYLKKDTYFNVTGVSNEGVVAGYEAWAGPYFLWNADENETTEIGGAAPGDGVGGKAQFSEDGMFLSGSSFYERELNTDWERLINSEHPYIYMGMEFPEGQSNLGYAVGQSLTYNGNGIVVKTTNGGESWSAIWTDTEQRGIEAMSFPNLYVGYVAGWNGYMAKTSDGGNSWTELDPTGEGNVYYFSAIEFKNDLNGVATAVLNTDVVTVFTTSDGGTTWSQGSGLEAIPLDVEFISDNTYLLVTNQGHVQKSTDNGLTWTTVFESPSGGFFTGIRFNDPLNGYILGESDGAGVYKTTDGGANWEYVDVFGSSGNYAIWRDVNWISPEHLIMVGTPDMIYESTDGGENWTWSNETIFNGNTALYEVIVTDQAVHVCGSQGNFYKKSLHSTITAAEMSRYDVAENVWTPLGNLGQQVDISTSSGYSISGDGNTVVGLAYADDNSAHGFAWNAEDGVIDLGSIYEGRNARANAVNYDGSVIVGWQDFNGPWKSAVWTRNEDGTYNENHFLLVDPTGDANDQMNQLGEARAVSADGNWIGGEGDFAFPNAWLWNAEEGLVDLGNLGLEDANGYVSAINEDGTMVVGWFQQGGGPWNPLIYTPFIWTPEMGAVNLNDYIVDTLGFDLGGDQIYVANDLSPNGQFITGWGIDAAQNPISFRLQLFEDTMGVEDPTLSGVKIYPNPATDILMIESPSNLSSYQLFDLTGKLILTASELNHTKVQLNISSIPVGVYVLKMQIEGKAESVKIIKK